MEEYFWRNFLGGFFGRIFWEEFFGRNYLVEIDKELMFLSRFCCLNAQGRKEGRKEGQEFRSLEVRSKLIAPKNVDKKIYIRKWTKKSKSRMGRA